jgi:hypothetical protein
VLGDLNESGLENVVAEVRKMGGYVWPYFSRSGQPLISPNPLGKPSDCDAMLLHGKTN